MKHKTKGFIAMILALCLMMSLGIGALADNSAPSGGNQGPGNPGPGDDQGGGGGQDPNETGTQQDETQTQETTYHLGRSFETGLGYNTVKVENGTYNNGEATAGATITFKVWASGVTLEDNQEIIVTLNGTEVNPTSTTGRNTYSITMPSQDSVLAARIATYYDVTTVVTPTDGGNVTVQPNSAEAGETITVSANPTSGYDIESLAYTADGGQLTPISGSTFIMPASDVTVTATFKETTEPVKHLVTASDLHCDVSLPDGNSYAEGQTVDFYVNADRGYEVTSVYLDDSAISLTNHGSGHYSFTMPNKGVWIYATATAITPPADYHRISTYSNDAYGWVSVDETAKAGSTVYFRIAHTYSAYNYDYKVYVTNDRTGATVKYDYDAYHDRYSFMMPDDDVTICVYFDYVGTYSITKDVEGDGSIYVRSSADHGDTVWIEAAPNAGQSLTSLRVFYGEPWAYGDKGYYGYWDEAEVKYSTYWDAYYFTMPADDVVVYARFTDGATVDVVAGDHGDAKVSSRYAEKGDWVYITAYPDEGYEVDSVTVTDSLGRSVKVTELSYDYFLFTMPGTSVDVKVTFRAKDYDVFYDVSRGDWYYKAVRFVHEKGIMEGTGTHYFSPEADLSRGMLATILYRLEGSPAVSGYSGFSDVADTAYYAKAVAWAKANGIVNGVTATAYEPDTAVTREELAAILCRYAAFKGKDTAISYDYLAGFSDANTSHVYARPALNWAVAYDIINGQGNGVLAPRATATRAEVAQVLMNYLEVFD